VLYMIKYHKNNSFDKNKHDVYKFEIQLF
jgi:hypothetical protein